MIGVYKITNLINQKVYIGQSWDIEKRWIQHKRNKHNLHLNNAFQKYGIESFSFEVLVSFLNFTETQALLDIAEIFYIRYYKTTEKGYNKTFGGQGGKKTEETKRKISEIKKGKKPSEETKEKLRKISLGNKRALGYRHLKTTRIKMQKSHSKKIFCVETNKVYSSIIKAAKELRVDNSSISKVCRGKRKQVKDYRFIYYNEETFL